MSAWHQRKAKVLLWYWLNFHPAESNYGADYGRCFTEGESFEPDMSILNDRWSIGAGCHHEFYIDKDSTSWQDINISVVTWLENMTDKKRHQTIEWLKEMKGKPLGSWHSKYTLSESPHWDSLIRTFQLRRIINGE